MDENTYAEELLESLDAFEDQTFALEEALDPMDATLDWAEEASKPKKKFEWEKIKKKTITKFHHSSEYKKRTSNMSKEELQRLDYKADVILEKKRRQAYSVFLRHPYATGFVCTFLLGILGMILWGMKLRSDEARFDVYADF